MSGSARGEGVDVGFKAHLGWLAAVAVRTDSEQPEPVLAARIDLFDGQDREAREPYHVAGGWDGLNRVARPGNPRQVIRRGRAKQQVAATARLAEFRETLQAGGHVWNRAVVLVGRGFVGDLEHTLGSHAHIHVAEGDAIRDATRAALAEIGIPWIDQDEKSALGHAGSVLGLAPADIEAFLKAHRPPDAKSWTKEHRTIAVGAWLARV